MDFVILGVAALLTLHVRRWMGVVLCLAAITYTVFA
jgi:hypothetical protein